MDSTNTLKRLKCIIKVTYTKGAGKLYRLMSKTMGKEPTKKIENDTVKKKDFYPSNNMERDLVKITVMPNKAKVPEGIEQRQPEKTHKAATPMLSDPFEGTQKEPPRTIREEKPKKMTAMTLMMAMLTHIKNIVWVISKTKRMTVPATEPDDENNPVKLKQKPENSAKEKMLNPDVETTQSKRKGSAAGVRKMPTVIKTRAKLMTSLTPHPKVETAEEVKKKESATGPRKMAITKMMKTKLMSSLMVQMLMFWTTMLLMVATISMQDIPEGKLDSSFILKNRVLEFLIKFLAGLRLNSCLFTF